MSDGKLRVAMAQVSADADIGDAIANAGREGADIVVFPEMFSNGYSAFDPSDVAARSAWLAAAIDPEGSHIETYRRAARENDIAVVATFLEAAEPKPFNTAVLIDRTGVVRLKQRKRHICFFDTPELACAAGSSSKCVAIDTGSGPVSIGIQICMDREYPDVVTDLARGGAKIILVPNASPLVDDEAVGDVRVAGVRASAFQSVLGMAVVNYPAPAQDGHSFAVDSLGRIIAMAGDGPEFLVAEFDLDDIRRCQKEDWFRRVF